MCHLDGNSREEGKWENGVIHWFSVRFGFGLFFNEIFFELMNLEQLRGENKKLKELKANC